MKRIGALILGLLVIQGVNNRHIFAEPTTKQWAVIMNISGRQRMLSQKMSKEALLAAAQVDVEANRQNLKQTMSLFETSLNGLIDGDDSLNLPKCEFEDILGQLEKVRLLYAEMQSAINIVVSGGKPSHFDLQKIAKASLPLLNAMDKAVRMFEEEARKVMDKDPTIATVINIAGRQRMLSQKIAKEALLMYLKIDIESQSEYLLKSIALFEKSLNGLKDSNAEMGLPGTKDEAIKEQLEVVRSYWVVFKPKAEKFSSLSMEYISKEEIASLAVLSMNLLKESDKAVSMYETSAK